jgi:hypothetical protein
MKRKITAFMTLLCINSAVAFVQEGNDRDEESPYTYQMDSTTVEMVPGNTAGDAQLITLKLHLRFRNDAPVLFMPYDVVSLRIFGTQDAADFGSVSKSCVS